jgi:Fic/DOC family protein
VRIGTGSRAFHASSAPPSAPSRPRQRQMRSTRQSGLDTALERAVYTMFHISEVHPFDDGNGRVARVMMNAELVAGRQARAWVILIRPVRVRLLGGFAVLLTGCKGA